MASIKVVLKENQPKKDGTIPILIRVIANRKTKYFSTGYAVKDHQFREGSEQWVTKHNDSVLINAAIETKRAKLAETVYLADIEGREIDVDDLGNKKGRGTFFTAVKIRLNTLEANNQVASYNRLRAKLNILKVAWGRDVSLSDLSKTWVDKYISHRIKEGSKISTIKKDMTDLSTVINSLDSYDGKDWFKIAQKKLKADPINREKLTLDEIKLMESTRLYGLDDIARDMFLFSFYCHGMRFQNVAMFERTMIKNGVIRYRMNKGKKVREIEIHSKLQAIIDKYHGKPYMFPVVKELIKDNWQKKSLVDSACSLVNMHLKRVANICGIDKNISTHISRHSFSYLSLQRGVSMEILKDALGHSDFGTTQKYLKSLSDQQINQAVKGLYD
jgi:site-specific recombinase XerD